LEHEGRAGTFTFAVVMRPRMSGRATTCTVLLPVVRNVMLPSRPHERRDRDAPSAGQ
jgi:hypothetical protein